MPETFHNFQKLNWRCRQYLGRGKREQHKDQRVQTRDKGGKISRDREKKRRDDFEPREFCEALGYRSHHAVCSGFALSTIVLIE